MDAKSQLKQVRRQCFERLKQAHDEHWKRIEKILQGAKARRLKSLSKFVKK